MRIGINASFLRKPATGIGQVTSHFLQQLQVLATSFPADQSLEVILYLQEQHEDVFDSRLKTRVFLPRWWKRDDIFREWLWEKQVAYEAEEDGCDIFLSLSQSATVFDQSSRIRHVMIVHDIIPHIFPLYVAKYSQKFYWQMTERGIRFADTLIAVSNSTKNDLITRLGIENVRVHLAYPGLSSIFETLPSDGETARVLAQYGLKRGYIYHGGGLEIRKNAEGVLRAYAFLRAEKKKHLVSIPPLVISGRVHEKTNKLATDVVGLIAELDLHDCVRLLGYVPANVIPSLYRGAKFFVFPSQYEGFGLPVLEAMSMGCPVIASSNSSLPEVCGGAALLVDDMDISTLAVAMDRVLTETALREILSRQGRGQAADFSYTKFTKQIMQICLPS
ncbi:MAG: glycosyltransferase family 4 protein [Candidatus Moranbacteria bacterium]|nr:glycosyltransferase family 4 protein [Candidatus Moranbacteria bacterium]MBP9801621.1 glycosyltransferase family 4 protein [Candidatus Moranbacteria bacterium]